MASGSYSGEKAMGNLSHAHTPETVTVVQRLVVVFGQAKLGIPTSANERGLFH